MTAPSITETLSKLANTNPAAWKEYVKHVTDLYEGAISSVISSSSDGDVRMAQGRLAAYKKLKQAVDAVENTKGARHGNST